MSSSVKMVTPAENELLAQLESKSGKENHFLRTIANRPEVLKNFPPLFSAIMGHGPVERRTKELAYLTAAFTNQCAYCSAVHSARGKKAGITDAELDALRKGDDSGFGEKERAAIRFSRELTRTADAAEMRPALNAHFTDEQIVELTLVVALANFTNRFNNGLDLLPE